jgi:arsenate reductase (glutaredoxin)
MNPVIYGIPNCDTVKKTMNWLKANGIDYYFHDYKKDGISVEKLNDWLSQVPHEKLLNRASSTWKELSDEEKAAVIDNDSAIKIVQKNASVIKRPLLESDGKVLALGFDVAKYEAIFGVKSTN